MELCSGRPGVERPYGGEVNASPAPDLSIVIPAFNEAENLSVSLEELVEFTSNSDFAVEVIVVDDGSSDDTVAVVEAAAAHWPDGSRLRLLRHRHNKGKGAAVRTGMLAVKGEHAVFTDADLAYGTSQIAAVVSALEAGADVAIGRREHHRGLVRRVTGRLFSILVNTTRMVAVADPQCGLKGFRHGVGAVIFGLATIDDFAFDVEALVIAAANEFSVVEVPVRMRDPGTDTRHRHGTSVNLPRDTMRMLKSLRRIERNRRSGLYVVPALASRAPKRVVS